jgi:hypothetical protein
MATSKQQAAAQRNVRKAAKAAKQKKTIAKLPRRLAPLWASRVRRLRSRNGEVAAAPPNPRMQPAGRRAPGFAWAPPAGGAAKEA